MAGPTVEHGSNDPSGAGASLPRSGRGAIFRHWQFPPDDSHGHQHPPVPEEQPADVDVRVECIDGKFHAVDSSDMAFKTAAAHGLREALTAAGTVVLEPVSAVTVTVPAALQGEVLGDLSSRRGRITGTSALADGRSAITALVPEAELGRYVLDLRSLTGGRGEFAATHDHYEPLPENAPVPTR